MNTRQPIFTQMMETIHPQQFARCVTRYAGEYKMQSFSCWDQFLCMGFGQLTYRESMRDTVDCLCARPDLLYHLGFRDAIRRSTLADANENRDWRIYATLAQQLIRRARRLYADEPLATELDATVYALDSTTIDLCLSVFPWARFRRTKAAIKLHTLLDLRGPIPTFVYISDGKLHDVNVLNEVPIEPGSFYVMDRGYLDFARLYVLHQQGGFFVIRAKNPLRYNRLHSLPVDVTTGVRSDQIITLTIFYSRQGYPERLRRVRFFDAETDRFLCLSDEQLRFTRSYHRPAVQKPVASGIVFQMDQTTSADQKFLRHLGQCGQDPSLDRHLRLCAGGHFEKATQFAGKSPQNPPNIERQRIRENRSTRTTYANCAPVSR